MKFKTSSGCKITYWLSVCKQNLIECWPPVSPEVSCFPGRLLGSQSVDTRPHSPDPGLTLLFKIASFCLVLVKKKKTKKTEHPNLARPLEMVWSRVFMTHIKKLRQSWE